MSGKPSKMKAYDSFSDWKRDQSSENQLIIAELEKLVKSVSPDLTTTVKWGQGCWLQDNTPVIFIHTEPDHVQLGFYAGSSFDDPETLLSGSGKFVRFVKVYDVESINAGSYSELLKQAIK